MKNKHDHYKELERVLTVFVLADLAMFIGYLAAAIAMIPVLKIIFAGLVIAVSCFGIWLLFNTKEFKQPRSSWIRMAFCCILLCVTVSMLCNFP